MMRSAFLALTVALAPGSGAQETWAQVPRVENQGAAVFLDQARVVNWDPGVGWSADDYGVWSDGSACFAQYPFRNCVAGHGASEDVDDDVSAPILQTVLQCARRCRQSSQRCDGFVWQKRNGSYKYGKCWLRASTSHDPNACYKSSSKDTYRKLDEHIGCTGWYESRRRRTSRGIGWEVDAENGLWKYWNASNCYRQMQATNCHSGTGALDLDDDQSAQDGLSEGECAYSCEQEDRCDGFVWQTWSSSYPRGMCWRKSAMTAHEGECQTSTSKDSYRKICCPATEAWCSNRRRTGHGGSR